jgi:uncharacterized protein YkwD
MHRPCHFALPMRQVPEGVAEWPGSMVLPQMVLRRHGVTGGNGTTALLTGAAGGRTVLGVVEEDPRSDSHGAAALTLVRDGRSRAPMARATGLAAVALLGAVMLTVNPQPATAFNAGSAAATLFQLMNGARVNNGLHAVQQNSTLVSLAQWRSKDQVERDYFDHTVKGTSYQVYHWYDLNGLQYSWGGENIGWNNGYSDGDSPVAIHQGFMKSPDHRHNILEPSFTHGGVGAYGKDNVMFLGAKRSPRFYTELFMTATSAAPPPSGGGGGGSGGGGSAAPTAPSGGSSPRHHKTARTLHVEASAPRASDPLDGPSVVASLAAQDVPAAAQSALAERAAGSTAAAAPAEAAGEMRIQAAGAPEQGVFESVLSSLLGFVF